MIYSGAIAQQSTITIIVSLLARVPGCDPGRRRLRNAFPIVCVTCGGLSSKTIFPNIHDKIHGYATASYKTKRDTFNDIGTQEIIIYWH